MMEGNTLFLGFDNTFMPFDVMEDLLKKYSIDRRWIYARKRFRDGKIGSRERIERELSSLRLTRRQAERYLEGLSPDPGFRRIVSELGKDAQPVILSDNFYFFIDRIAKNSGLDGIKIISTQARFHRDRIIPLFSVKGPGCLSCAICKKRHVSAQKKLGNHVIYAGAGVEEACAAGMADVIFAKGGLAKRLRAEGKIFHPFNSLSDLCDGLEKLERPRSGGEALNSPVRTCP